LSEALEHVARFGPRQAVLTNLHIDLDYAETERVTPTHVHPAFDGMTIDII
jgi:phosphoribosyl 1,2-cyclic phosphate phosphodiesterase